MPIFEIIVVIVVCAFFTVFFYGLWLVENDRDEFRKKHGVDPKYYSCVTKGDMDCTHSDWCEAEIALFPEQYEYEMKLKENDTNKDQ